MNRMAYFAGIAVLVGGASGAAAQDIDGGLGKLQTDCGRSDLAEAAIDGCLARAQELSQTNPSPALETLEAKLEERSTKAFNPNGVDAPAPNKPPAAQKADAAANSKSDGSDDPPPPLPEPTDEAAAAPPPPPGMSDDRADDAPPPPVMMQEDADTDPPPQATHDDGPADPPPVPPDDDTSPHK